MDLYAPSEALSSRQWRHITSNEDTKQIHKRKQHSSVSQGVHRHDRFRNSSPKPIWSSQLRPFRLQEHRNTNTHSKTKTITLNRLSAKWVTLASMLRIVTLTLQKNTENPYLSSIPVDGMESRPETPIIATHQVQRRKHLEQTPNSRQGHDIPVDGSVTLRSKAPLSEEKGMGRVYTSKYSYD